LTNYRLEALIDTIVTKTKQATTDSFLKLLEHELNKGRRDKLKLTDD